jgi:hypothetical protein
MSPKHWRIVNGFPNNFFGWGGEDDEMHHRLRLAGLLYGDCHPFCKPNDPSIGKSGQSIKRPPKGKGRFSGKYMHSANHTKRITDNRAYENNLKLLRQIQAGEPRWKSDGLSNLAFRIVSYEKDTADTAEHGITYHHVKVRRGRTVYDPKGITLAVSTSLCSPPSQNPTWQVETLGEPMPWTLEALRKRIGDMLKDHCSPPYKARSFILIDRRYHLAKLMSDENSALLVGFYRGLTNPSKDGLIVVDPRPVDQIRQAFEASAARIHPPTEYTICTSKLANGELKYSLHQGPACAGGWDKLPAGTFWAFTEKKADTLTVSFCDNSRYWVQRIIEDTKCEKHWQGLKWSIGGTFWVPSGNQFCVGVKSGGETPHSIALAQEDCNSNGAEHQFTFGSLKYSHTFGSFSLCVARKSSSGRPGALRLSVEKDCEDDGYTKQLSFRARAHGFTASGDKEFCVTEAGHAFSDECDDSKLLRFSVPSEAGNAESLLCAGPSLEDQSRNIIGMGEACRDGPDKLLEVRFKFAVPAAMEIAASVAGDMRSGHPFVTLVDEDVPCMGLFCPNAMACAEKQGSKSSVGKPCLVTMS